MKTPIKDYRQKRITGGEQKIILDEKETGETDELDPNFEDQAIQKQAADDDAKTKLI